MACYGDPAQRPPAKLEDPSRTTVQDLGGDILREIFLRLPSLTALIRAAFACREWRSAVASSPSFRRRFRALHPAPPLGLFFASLPPFGHSPDVPTFPTFVPSRRPDQDLPAAVRSGDFLLTSVQDLPGSPPGWDIVDCRGGSVLLRDWDEALLVVLNPLSWRRWRSRGIFGMPSREILEDGLGLPTVSAPRLVHSDEDPMSFRVVCLAYGWSTVRAVVFSSDTWEWRILPWVQLSVPPKLYTVDFMLQGSMQANGLFMYWVLDDLDSMITLNLTTMHFSVAELPQCLNNPRRSFVVGETKDGSPCLVYAAAELSIGVLLRAADDDGVDRWVQERVFSLGAQIGQVLGELLPFGLEELHVVAVRKGFVYLATSDICGYPQPCWFLSFCLETMELENQFHTRFDRIAYPYVLPWPPSLVGDYGRFAAP